MFCVVLDTNIIVSALWSKQSIPGKVLEMVLQRKVKTAVSQDVFEEYEEVLFRDKFRHKFSREEVDNVLFAIHRVSDYFVAQKSTTPHFTDETDKKFYDLAKSANAYLITGNIKHFPQDNKIITPADFLQYFSKKL